MEHKIYDLFVAAGTPERRSSRAMLELKYPLRVAFSLGTSRLNNSNGIVWECFGETCPQSGGSSGNLSQRPLRLNH
ncbi:hypothetical protein [Brevundimonas nasdae]|uniref:hypothetical protein n=1 Tax=Brevundimonas nasdae TaxID=172043 RepID=UPI003F690568